MPKKFAQTVSPVIRHSTAKICCNRLIILGGDAVIKVYDNDIIAQTSCVGDALKHSKIGLISGDGFQDRKSVV